jgi:periplasmic protein TonB
MKKREGFSQCLVDGDEQSLERARQLRRKALLASIILEAALVAALLLWPLITPGELPRQFFVTPAPPYHGGSAAPAPSRGTPHSNPGKPHPTNYNVIAQPAYIPIHVQSSSSDGAPEIGSAQGFGATNLPGSGSGPGDLLPGGGNSGPAIPTPPPAKPEKPRLMSEGVMEAALIQKVQPQYPTVARLMHVSGTVRLRAIIGKDGSVSQLEVLSGNPLLAQAAVAAVREWRYRPTRLNEEAVEIETYITVNFILDQR